jgi:hypothetical protein
MGSVIKVCPPCQDQNRIHLHLYIQPLVPSRAIHPALFLTRFIPNQPSSNMSESQAYEDDGNASGSSPVQSSRKLVVSTSELKGFGPLEQTPAISLPLSNNALKAAEKAVINIEYDFDSLLDECGYLGVIHFARQMAKKSRHKLAKDDLMAWFDTCIPLLTSVPIRLLHGLYTDGLCSNIAADCDLSELYDSGSPWVELGNDPFAPCIYVRELVDNDLLSPTVNQLIEVVESLRGYMSGDDKLAEQNSRIESQPRGVQSDPDSIREGRLLSLMGSEKRAAKLWTFCAALEKILVAIDEEYRDSPAPFTLKYVRYTRTAADWQSSYDKDQSQSWLAKLVRNVCKLLFPDSNFHLETNVVAYCCSHKECEFAEEIFTSTTHAYCEAGLGFCVTPVGGSISSSDLGKATHDTALKKWAKTDEFRMSIMPYYNMNMELLRDKVDAYEAYVVEWKEKGKSAGASAKAERKRKRESIAEVDTWEAKLLAGVEAAQQTLDDTRRGFFVGLEGGSPDDTGDAGTDE